MFRISTWAEKLAPQSFTQSNSSGIGVDLGSAQTKIVIQGELVFQQPTCVAFHHKTGEVVAIGHIAAALMGKAPPQITVVFPVRRGKIQDIFATQLFLQTCLKTILHQKTSARSLYQQMFRPPVTVAVPADMSEAEKEMVAKLFREINFTRVSFITQLEAAYRHLQQQRKVGRVFSLVNIGAMTTEMAFFAQGQMVIERSVARGSDDLTRAVMQQIQKQYQCQVGWPTAEKIKTHLGLPALGMQSKKMVVRGRDILSSLPTTIQVDAEELLPAYQPFIDDLIQSLTDLFQDTDPEVMAEGLDQGVMLTGGGSLLTGLASRIEQSVRAPMHISDTAIEDVVRGI
jgi:rod shape-determining protein MreB